MSTTTVYHGRPRTVRARTNHTPRYYKIYKPTMSIFKLAILECDQPLDAARIGRGGHHGVWTTLFAAAAQSEGINPGSIQCIRYNAEEALPSIRDIDGILISGSRYNAWADDAWIINLVAFTRECVAAKKPVIGICFGHQIVGRALGGEVNRNENGWEVAPTVLTLSDKGKQIFGKEAITLHLMNRDIVQNCPSDMEILASSPKTQIHSLYRPGEVFTVQGHPEFDQEIIAELLKMRMDSGVIPEDTGADGLSRKALPHDGVPVTAAFLKFLGIQA